MSNPRGDMDLTRLIRNVQDFPKPGIGFKDITTLLLNGPAFRHVVERLAEFARKQRAEVVVGAEARGFLFAAPVACRLGIGVVPVRKPGKLPAATLSEEYALEYGTDKLELHRDAIGQGQRVLVVDDLLATGGTVGAMCRLVEKAGGSVAGVAFLVELDFLHGRKRLNGYEVCSLVHYTGE